MPEDKKEEDKPFRQFIEELHTDLENWQGEPVYVEAKQAEIRFWIDVADALKHLDPSADISDETPMSNIAQLAISSLRRLAEKEKLIKPRKVGSGRKSSFTPDDFREAIWSLGVMATQKKVAAKLGVTERALRAWQKKQGFAKWSDTRRYYVHATLSRLTKRKKK